MTYVFDSFAYSRSDILAAFLAITLISFGKSMFILEKKTIRTVID